MTETALTPALLDLMDHEKVIEQGLASFVEVGLALVAIKADKKYRAANYATFEAYCLERWGLGHSHRQRLMVAAATAEELISPMGEIPVPTNERQVRPLTALPTVEARREAWEEAVEDADGGQPTHAQVQAAVEKRQPPKRDHPAPFSDPILAKVAERVRGADVVLDPFAGTGRVHELRELAGVRETIGVEIEPEWASKHPDTIEGDALALPQADASVDAVATSPTYGNRMADHHDATDDSVRLTYKHTLGRELHEHNSGSLQWGDEYREFHRKAWAESIRVLKPGGVFVLNIKDHIRDGVKREVAAWHIDTMCRTFGMELAAIDILPTAGLMAGANHDAKVCAELVLTFRKPT